MTNEVKLENDTNVQLAQAMDAMSKWSFYLGIERGLKMAMNTIMLKYVGMSMEQYSKAAFKPQVHQMAAVSQIINMLAAGLQEVDNLTKIAEGEAQKAAEEEAKQETESE